MKSLLLLVLFLPLFCFTQEVELPKSDTIFNQIPFSNNEIIYEKVFQIDSVNNRDKIYNSAKAALIQNTNYKYSKIDEDRSSGSITSEIVFFFVAKPGIAKLSFKAICRLSIDVKENRFRVRLYNNTSSFELMGQLISYVLRDTYLLEKERISNGKWKASKSVVLPWHEKLSNILNAFGVLVKQGMKDDNF